MMVMRRSTVLLVALTLVGCSQFDVRSDYDRQANFGRLRTFSWLPYEEAEPADQRVPDRYIDRRIRTAVETELRAKGYQPTDGTAPDFLLNYRFSREPGSAVQGNPHFRGHWSGAQMLYEESYDDGALYLWVIDPPSRHVLWIGAASARLLPHISLERRAKRVDAVVHKLLARFPPS